MRRRSLAVVVVAAISLVLVAAQVSAKTLRWSTQGDPQTMDPYSQNEQLTNNVNGQVYETLVNRDRQLNVVPVLGSDVVWNTCEKRARSRFGNSPWSSSSRP